MENRNRKYRGKVRKMKGKLANMQKSGLLARSQKGVVLVVSLIILLVVTLIATTNMETSILEERMAGNIQDYNVAFQAAEASMEVAETWLSNQVVLPTTSTDGSTDVWTDEGPSQMGDTDEWWRERSAAWWSANADTIAGMSGVDSQPQYVIEEHFTSLQGQSLVVGTGQSSNTRILHRITSRGVGANGNTQVMIQSTYIRPYD
jgi:type IV pilus assembly protein PilX